MQRNTGGLVESGTLDAVTQAFTPDDKIRCGDGATACTAGYAWNATVAMRATPTTAGGYLFEQWAGDCQGASFCALSGNADKYVVAVFVTKHETHPNWSAVGSHTAAARDWLRSAPGSYACADCHGATFQGQGIAPSCYSASCHATGSPHNVASATDPIKAKIDAAIDAAVDVAATTPLDGRKVTAICVKCHQVEASEMLGTMHFTWAGGSRMVGQVGLGKQNLINNFCVAVASNEARCNQCHPSYSSPPTKDPASGAVAVNTGPMYLWAADAQADKTRIDCLICHANLGPSGYVKAPAGWGAPWPKNLGSCYPACSAGQFCDIDNTCKAPTEPQRLAVLAAAAKDIGAPKRNNCGFCHFNAGGGDNVKMGDLGSDLAFAAPAPARDVHMGATTSPKTCASCHAAAGHKLKGTGLSIPADDEGRVGCTDCHTGALHASSPSQADLNSHAAYIACQTCHIPEFSRGNQYTKTFWDWQTAFNKVNCTIPVDSLPPAGMTVPGGSTELAVGTNCVAFANSIGGESQKLNQTADMAFAYHWQKGVARYEKHVVPTYRWFDGKGTHETTDSPLNLLGDGTVASPYVLSGTNAPPSAIAANMGWKISPFKKMEGRSPAFSDGSSMIVPHAFGSDGFWQADLRGFPVVGNTFGSGTPTTWSQSGVDAIWKNALNYGAAVAKQLGAPIAKVPAGQMTRAVSGTTHTVTVNVTPAAAAANRPATLFLVGTQPEFPTGVKTVTWNGDGTQFTYTEAIPYTANASASPPVTLTPPTLADGESVSSTKFAAFFKELPAWKWASTVMYVNINHEVAERTAALACGRCHTRADLGGTGDVNASRMKELYNLGAGSPVCNDPADCKKRVTP